MIKVGHLRRYVKEVDHREESRLATNGIIARAAIPLESRSAINYLLGDPSNGSISQSANRRISSEPPQLRLPEQDHCAPL